MRTWRVYFNRKREAPQVFSVDEGDQTSETNVIGVKGHGVDFEFHYNGEKVNEDHPSAWQTVSAHVLVFEHGIAHFYSPEAWEARVTYRRLDELP